MSAADEHRRPSILLVEDDELVCSVLARALRSRGYDVRTAQDAAQALASAETSGQLDLLVTDVNLPQGGGEALAAELRRLGHIQRTLFMSGHGREELNLAPEANFLAKPFVIEELLGAVEHALRTDPPG